jgi:hypothetical protein
MPEGIGYAVWGKLDSLNDIEFPAKSRQYCGGFDVLACFAII